MQLRVQQILEIGQEIKDIKFKIKVLIKLAELACANNKPFWLNMSEQLDEPRVYQAAPGYPDETDYAFSKIVEDLQQKTELPKNSLLRADCFYNNMEAIIREFMAGRIKPAELSKVTTCDKCNCEMLKLKNHISAQYVADLPPKKIDPYNDYRKVQQQAQQAAMLSLLFGPSEVLRLCQCLKPMLEVKLEKLQTEYHQLCAKEFGAAPDQK